MAVHPSGSPVYVTDWFEHRIFVVSPEKGAIEAEVSVGNSPSGIAVTADGSTIVTADRDSDRLSFIDAKTLTVRGTAKTGSRPFGVTIDEATHRVFAANVASNSVTVADLASGKVLAEVKVGERPYAVALASGKAFVTNQYAGTLSVFDAQTYAAACRNRDRRISRGHRGQRGRQVRLRRELVRQCAYEDRCGFPEGRRKGRDGQWAASVRRLHPQDALRRGRTPKELVPGRMAGERSRFTPGAANGPKPALGHLRKVRTCEPSLFLPAPD